jgi:hypothetical protein
MRKVEGHVLRTMFMRNQDFKVDGGNSKLCTPGRVFDLMRE